MEKRPEINIPRLMAAYYTEHPDAGEKDQRVAFGTSGHRGTSLKRSFNEDHIAAVSQAICEYRAGRGIACDLPAAVYFLPRGSFFTARRAPYRGARSLPHGGAGQRIADGGQHLLLAQIFFKNICGGAADAQAGTALVVFLRARLRL